MPLRSDLRNVAIVAHVDHGKTTLVDAMLWQSGAFRVGQTVKKRVMDSMDLEREKGITILAKNTAVRHHAPDGSTVTINIIDTPGHADFGGEVERGLEMVDGVLLLVDASEGPLPQTRFVLRKALAKKLPIVVVINKVDRHDARIAEVVEETYELFLDLLDDDSSHASTSLWCTPRPRLGAPPSPHPSNGQMPDSGDLAPLFATILQHIPAPSLCRWGGAAGACDQSRRVALPRPARAVPHRRRNLRRNQNVAWCRADGTIRTVKLTELLMTNALDREPAESAGPGDIVAIAGIPEITIGETLSDPDDPRPLPLITVDEPSISMTVGINTSPLAGQSGKNLTARLVKARLDTELVGNVSIRVFTTERPDTWEVQGRGELQLAILVEMMRRESFEITVGKPQVVTRTIGGKVHEPVERLTIDIPEDFVGVVTQLLGLRRGRLEQMVNHGTGWVRMEYLVPARGLIGFRTEFLTETRGTGLMHHVFEGYEPWAGEMRTRPTGALVADRSGQVTAYALFNLQERGTMFVNPGMEVYEGMIVGENARSDDMDVNPTREKKLTNVRSSTGEELERLVPPRLLSLEQALEFCRTDECLEVTPDAVRIRKVVLSGSERARSRARAKQA